MADHPANRKVQRWFIQRLSLPLLLLNGWCLLLIVDYFRTPITILILGAIFAFLLEHPVQWLARLKINRMLAILLVLFTVILVVGILGATIFPLLAQQANDLAFSVSDWAKSSGKQLQDLHKWAVSRGIPIDLTGIYAKIGSDLASQLQVIATRLPGFVEMAVGGVFETLLTLVVTIYLLLKGKRLWSGIFEWFPPKLGARVKTTLPRSFRNYFRGQVTVGLLLGLLMTVGFLLFRIPFGLLFGSFIGLMGILPFGGTISITIVTLLVSLKSIGLGLTVLAIAIVIQQIVENGIAPRLLGELTGVHPVWVIITLLIGAKIAGVMGVILAVPLTSFIKDVMEVYKPKYALSSEA